MQAALACRCGADANEFAGTLRCCHWRRHSLPLHDMELFAAVIAGFFNGDLPDCRQQRRRSHLGVEDGNVRCRAVKQILSLWQRRADAAVAAQHPAERHRLARSAAECSSVVNAADTTRPAVADIGRHIRRSVNGDGTRSAVTTRYSRSWRAATPQGSCRPQRRYITLLMAECSICLQSRIFNAMSTRPRLAYAGITA